MKKKLFVIDMDHTILDTAGLKEGLGRFLANDPEMSASKIVEFFQNNDSRVEKYIKENIKKFLFEGVDEKLRKLNENNELILLTYGLVSFQLLKTKALPLEYFDDVILTEDDRLKIKTMKKIVEKYPEHEIYFINDNLRQNDAIRKEFSDKVLVSDIDNYDEKKNNDIGSILGDIIAQIALDIHSLKEKLKDEDIKDEK